MYSEIQDAMEQESNYWKLKYYGIVTRIDFR